MVEGAEQESITVEEDAELAPAQSKVQAALNALNIEFANALNVREEVLKTAQSVLKGVGTGARIDDTRIKAAVHGLMDSDWCYPEASLLLIRTRQFGAELFTHAVNVCLVPRYGQAAKVDPELLQALARGAFLHDVRQLRISRNIPQKTGLYTPQERKMMQKHSEFGAAMLRRSGMSEDVCRVVLEHHKQPDGSGSQQCETIFHPSWRDGQSRKRSGVRHNLSYLVALSSRDILGQLNAGRVIFSFLL